MYFTERFPEEKESGENPGGEFQSPCILTFATVSNTWRIFEISQDWNRILAAFHRCCYYYHGTAGTSRSSGRSNKEE